MVPVENPFMDKHLKMKTLPRSMMSQEFYQWLMLDQTQMEHNFLSQRYQLHIWMVSMLFFGKVSDSKSMDVVKAIEALGSETGETKKKIEIAKSGLLPDVEVKCE